MGAVVIDDVAAEETQVKTVFHLGSCAKDKEKIKRNIESWRGEKRMTSRQTQVETFSSEFLYKRLGKDQNRMKERA